MWSEPLPSSAYAFRRGADWPVCPRCGEMLLAAVSSVLVERGHIRHLWACDACGYSFPTAVRLGAADGEIARPC